MHSLFNIGVSKNSQLIQKKQKWLLSTAKTTST
jgi:hypothetical protein